ncbi:multicopper oxidase family protein [Profundibacter amoris]|uniref:Multicopper oxidase CueO n=1 Tax=Profundibacter amoris TaxID=2171755 RepID=A0A347UFD9_9RHOB|nr:multicopper oxidase domain-containing protein [Profundibacter amoris]AXX97567.1 cupredoxin [Profundibacter amoris]
MTLSRRQFIGTATATFATPALIGRAIAATGGRDLPIPDVLDLRGGGGAPTLDAMAARTKILEGAESVTVGYGQGFLGPVIRMNRGETARLNLGNRIKEPVTVHWHGMHIDGAQDGGPHSPVDTGGVLEAALDIDQPAATLWYHSHIHQRTGIQVYYGLAGMLIIDDPDAPDSGLPQTYGVDDIPLVVQDRVFDRGGQMLYAPQGPTRMMGYRGSEILVNGAIRPKASVPAGMVRLRILNGSNARIYHFGFEDGRRFYQVASDGGLLPMPVAMNALTLAPAERVEIVVDFSAGATRLLSAPDSNMGMMGGGMMGGMMRGASPKAVADGGLFEVMSFAIDNSRTAAVTTLAKTLAGAPTPVFGEPVRRRRFALNMGMGMGMMRGGGSMAINGDSMDMAVINQELRLGEAEIWEVSADMMAHPFHVHGTSFQVLSRNGRKVDYASTGLKDVVLVDGTAELLVQVNRKADANQPFMFHCHILEHEDLGMMGQFTVA